MRKTHYQPDSSAVRRLPLRSGPSGETDKASLLALSKIEGVGLVTDLATAARFVFTSAQLSGRLDPLETNNKQENKQKHDTINSNLRGMRGLFSF